MERFQIERNKKNNKMKKRDIHKTLSENGLKLTPQRIAVYEALAGSKKHPSADEIFREAKKIIPSISLASVYNILDVFQKKNIITTVQTADDTVRYDANTDLHCHLYDKESGKIVDYCDKELNEVLKEHFENKDIPDFEIEDIKIELIGKFEKISL